MKVSISNDILDQNVEKINEFLSKKGMSLIMGGDKELTILACFIHRMALS